MSYDEHLISTNGGDGEADVLGEIEARRESYTDGCERHDFCLRADFAALLAVVREQRAVLDAVQKLMQAAWDGQTYVLPGGYPSRPVEAFDLRAALTATEAAL